MKLLNIQALISQVRFYQFKARDNSFDANNPEVQQTYINRLQLQQQPDSIAQTERQSMQNSGQTHEEQNFQSNNRKSVTQLGSFNQSPLNQQTKQNQKNKTVPNQEPKSNNLLVGGVSAIVGAGAGVAGTQLFSKDNKKEDEKTTGDDLLETIQEDQNIEDNDEEDNKK